MRTNGDFFSFSYKFKKIVDCENRERIKGDMSIFMVCFGVGLAVSICLLYVHVCEIVMFYEQIRVSEYFSHSIFALF